LPDRQLPAGPVQQQRHLHTLRAGNLFNWRRNRLHAVRTRIVCRQHGPIPMHALRGGHLPEPIRCDSVHLVPRRSDVCRRKHKLHSDHLPARPVRQQQHLHPLPGRQLLCRRRGHGLQSLRTRLLHQPIRANSVHLLSRRDLSRPIWGNSVPSMSRGYVIIRRQQRLHAGNLPTRPVRQQWNVHDLLGRLVLERWQCHVLLALHPGHLCR
jgi:hypothetical protein